MKKFNLFTLLVIGALTFGIQKNANAQFSAGLFGGMGLPMGDFGNKTVLGANNGFGGGVKARYAINDNLHVGIGITYYKFSAQEVDLGYTKMKPDYSLLPISFSADYYFMTDEIKPYATLDLNLAHFSQNISIGGISSNAVSETKPGFGIGAGLAYALTDNLDAFGVVKYQSVFATGTSISWVGINLGASMSFGN